MLNLCVNKYEMANALTQLRNKIRSNQRESVNQEWNESKINTMY